MKKLINSPETVVQDEWPALAAGHADEAAGWQLLDRFPSEVINLRASDPSVSRMQADAQLAVDGIGSPPKNPPPVTVQRAVPSRNTPRPKVRVIRAA